MSNSPTVPPGAGVAGFGAPGSFGFGSGRVFGAAGLQCAICHHVRFLHVETDRFDGEDPPEIRQAVTLIDGTAVCALHIEDYDRSLRGQGWLLRIAGSILGVPIKRNPFTV